MRPVLGLALAFLTIGSLGAQETASIPASQSQLPKIRIAAGGGYAFLFKNYDELSRMITQDDDRTTNGSLRHNYALQLDAQYFFSKHFGVGLQANMNHGSIKSMEIHHYRSPISSVGGTYFDHARYQTIFYLGPSFNYRLPLKRFTFLGEIGFGGVFYRQSINDKHSNDKLSIRATRSSIGGNLGFGGEFSLSRSVAVGLKVSANIGSVGVPKIKDETGYFGESFVEKLVGEGGSVSCLMITAFISFQTGK